MAKFTANEARAALELGHSSLWAASFSNVPGSNAPDTSVLNMIKSTEGGFTPALDVSYDQLTVVSGKVDVGLGFFSISTPRFVQEAQEVKLTLLDDHRQIVRDYFRAWTDTAGIRRVEHWHSVRCEDSLLAYLSASMIKP